MDLHGKRLLCLNKAMRALPHLSTLLGCTIDFAGPRFNPIAGSRVKPCNNASFKPFKDSSFNKAQPVAYDGVLVWGKKPSAKRGEAYAAKHQLPVVRVEDGFLRSVGLGPDDPPLSVVIDDVGIYYDASAPSRLEAYIRQPLSNAEHERAQRLIQTWRESRVSKYNQGREWGAAEVIDKGAYVLLIDQTFGDASIEYGAADASVFIHALQDAVAKYPNHRVIVKTHPDVIAGRKQGHFSSVPAELQGKFELLGAPIHLPALLEHAAAVFCVTSQAGFEALLWGKPVHVYGMPFYAGWGLTQDKQATPSRREPIGTNAATAEHNSAISLEQLAFAALIRYPRYVHPERQSLCEVEELLAWMGLQRQMHERFAPQVEARRWSRWKRPVIKRFMAGSNVQFVKELSDSIPSLGWGARAQTDIRVEDGFIRSVGLGADLTMPQSWVVDDVGMYYDATRPSRLEQIYRSHEFDEGLCNRALALIETLQRQKVTKYNVGRSDWRRPNVSGPVILVPGQVESDASIQMGSPVVRTNLELLRRVREANPEAYIVYKPHPDVQAGLRVAGSDKQGAADICDELVLDQDMAGLLEQVDEVHTITSLTGFEALLRDRSVVCYGQPFYSGWGLTTDMYPCDRRTRTLTLAELVAGALILYPSYISQATGRFCTPERVINELSQVRQAPPKLTFQPLKRLLLRCWRF